MDSQIMTNIKGSSLLPNDTQGTAISIVVRELSGNEHIKEEVERQFKNIHIKESPLITPTNFREASIKSSVMRPKKKRGRPRVSQEKTVINKNLPPLMVNQREKRKRSSKFNTFLEVLRGEKEFYIEDDGVEPKAKKRGGGRKKKNLATVLAENPTNDDGMETMCVIQVNDIDVHEREEVSCDRDRLNLDEVVQEIFGMTPEAETSFIHDIEKLDQDNNLISVIDEMNDEQEEANENIDLKKIVNMTNIKFEKDNANIEIKAEVVLPASTIKTEVVLPASTANSPSIEVTEIKEDLAANIPSLEMTITQSENDRLCAEINDPDDLNSIAHDTVDQLESRIKQNECEKRFRCKLCSEVFFVKEDARRHAKEWHTESHNFVDAQNTRDSSFKCSECDRSFPTARGRDRHYLHTHLKNKPVACPECDKNFNSFRPLERHLRNQHDLDPKLFCEMCDAEFVLGTALEHHKEIMHPVSGKRNLMKNSVLTKTKDSNKSSRMPVFECPFCSEKIRGTRALKIHHQNKHNGKEYCCKFCKYKSACLSTMNRHMVKVHKALDIKLYNCQKCVARYQDPRDLEEHCISVHHLKPSLLCQHCGEKFACMDMLRFHRNSHRAFSCKLCHSGFMKEEALEDHIKAIHNCDPAGSAENSEYLNQVEQDNNYEEMQQSAKENSEEEAETKTSTANSKVLVITSDGSVEVKEEMKEVNIVSSVPSEDITLHLQQTREGGLEEIDMLNPLKGQKFKDLPKKMNCPICDKVLTTKFIRTHMLSHKGKGNLPHKCRICDKAYAQGTLLRKHMKNRHYSEFLKMGNKNPKKHKVTCDFCQEIFDSIYILEEHLWEHMDKKTYECKDCKIKFGMESNLREHYKSHFFKEGKLCPVCRREFKSIGFYNEHVERCQQRWKCEHCGLECDSQEYYRKHQRAEHGGDNVVRYQCNQCEKSFVERHRYDDHIITHSSKKAFTCRICFKQFKRQRPLNDHILRTHSVGLFLCSYCRKAFSTQQDLNAHKLKHRKEFPCTSCNYAYASSEALMNHVMVHHSDTPHVCHICSQFFHKQADLKAHLITHSSNTPNICFVDGCHKMFRSEALLRNHMSRRHHELQYECTICDRKFSLESDQIRHIATHSGEVSLTCDECGKIFQNETLLENHILSHCQEKPYECRVCHHTAVLRHKLVHHIQTEHGFDDTTPHLLVNRWQCSVCGKMFVARVSLLRHLQRHTNQGIEAEGHAVKTRSTPTSALELSVPTGMVDPAAATTSFLEQVSTLSWQDLTPLLRIHVIPSEDEGPDAKSADVWQCPGCHDVTHTEETMRDHLVGSSQCQEAVILQLACGFSNTDELEDEHTSNSTYDNVLDDKGSGAVLQLTGSDGGMQYVIVQEDNNTQKLTESSKENNSDQEGDRDMQVLVSMEDDLQHLLSQQTHPNIQIIVEDTAPLKQLLTESVNETEHSSAQELIRGEESQASDLLNGSEVLLQTPEGHLVLQQTVGGVTQFQLVEGVAAGEQGDDTQTTLLTSQSSTLHPEFILPE